MIEALDLTDRKIIKPEDTSLAIIIRSAVRNPDGSIAKTGHNELRERILAETQRITPVDRAAAGRVASALERIFRTAYGFNRNDTFEAHRGSAWGPASLSRSINEREKRALQLHQGNEAEAPRTYVEIGQELGVSATGAHQIVSRARRLSASENATRQTAYDALTINHLEDAELSRLSEVGPKTAADLGAFLLAELNPELVLNPQALTKQLTLDI